MNAPIGLVPALPPGYEVWFPDWARGDEETMLIRKGDYGMRIVHDVPHRSFERNVGSFFRPQWKEYRVVDEDALYHRRMESFKRAFAELEAIDTEEAS